MAGAVQEILFVPDFKQGELRNTVLHILPFDPATPVEGQYWYNSTTKTLNFYNGSTVSVLARLNDDTHNIATKLHWMQLQQPLPQHLTPSLLI
jgi:hypothetical protein